MLQVERGIVSRPTVEVARRAREVRTLMLIMGWFSPRFSAHRGCRACGVRVLQVHKRRWIEAVDGEREPWLVVAVPPPELEERFGVRRS